MDILNSKSIINNEINNIMKDYKDLTEKHNQQIVSFSNDIKRLNDFNGKLLMETNEKDKLLSQKDKTIYDYEQIINKNEEELNHKEKFDIIRNQDKLINDQKKTIDSLKKLTGKTHKGHGFKLSENIGFSPTSSKHPHQNQYEKSPYGDVKSNVMVKLEEVGKEEVVKEEVVKEDVKEKVVKEKVVKEKVVKKVVKEKVVKKDVKEKVVLKLEEKVVKEEVDLKLEEDVEEVDLKLEEDVEEVDLKLEEEEEEEEEEDVEEGVDVDVIMYRKKEYYIIIGEKPQYIYNILEDKDIGEKIGELNGKKKEFYKNKK